MYLLWLRVAAILYAADVSPSSRPCSRTLIPLAQDLRPPGRHGLLLPLRLRRRNAGAGPSLDAGRRARVESLLGFAVAGLFFLVWWLYDAISLGIFALPATFFLVFVPALGPDRYTFPSQGVRTSWLVAHIIALLLAYAALGFSLLASMLYLVQERRIKASPSRGRLLVGAAGLAAAARHAGAHRPRHAEFGFPCMTVGLVIGSVLVQETSLGAAYFLDPKIIASFVMWAVYVLLLLVRRGAGLRGRKAAYLSGRRLS
jgi:ABC-type uncharacterized transport system permease subunit